MGERKGARTQWKGDSRLRGNDVMMKELVNDV